MGHRGDEQRAQQLLEPLDHFMGALASAEIQIMDHMSLGLIDREHAAHLNVVIDVNNLLAQEAILHVAHAGNLGQG